MARSLQPTGTRRPVNWSRVTVEPSLEQNASPDLAVGMAGDKNSPVADAMADQVTAMPAPENEQSSQEQTIPEEKEQEVQAKQEADFITGLVQRKTASEEPQQKVQTQQEAGESILRVQRQPVNSSESHPNQTRADHLNEAQTLFDLGVLQAQIGNYQGALELYAKALKLAPNNSLIWYNRGVVLSQLNRLQEALEAYQTALAMNSNWGEEGQPYFAWNNRGTILRRLGRFNEAIQSYQQALALDPGNQAIQNNLRNLEAYLSANPSLRNQSQQIPAPVQGNNLLQTLLGGLQGAFNENQTGDEAIADFLIGLIPIIGQLADARDFAAYLYRIVFKRQFNDAWNWVGLALTLVGLVPIVGDIAKFLGKTVVRGGLSALGSNLEDVLKLIRSINPGFVDDIAQLKGLLDQNWGKGVQAAKDRWNTALGQLLNWVNGIPDILFSQQKRQLIEAVQEVKSQSDKMLSRAFDEIRRKIDEALDELGRLINPNGQLVTPEGVRLPSNRADEVRQGPLRIEGRDGENPQNQRRRNTEPSLENPPSYANQVVREQWKNWPETVRQQYLGAQARIENGSELVRRMSQAEYEAIFGDGRGTIRDVFISSTEQVRVFSIDRAYQFSDSARNRASGYERVVRIQLSAQLRGFLRENLAPDNIPGGLRGGLRTMPRFKLEDGDYNIVVPKASWDTFRSLIQNHTVEIVE